MPATARALLVGGLLLLVETEGRSGLGEGEQLRQNTEISNRTSVSVTDVRTRDRCFADSFTDVIGTDVSNQNFSASPALA